MIAILNQQAISFYNLAPGSSAPVEFEFIKQYNMISSLTFVYITFTSNTTIFLVANAVDHFSFFTLDLHQPKNKLESFLGPHIKQIISGPGDCEITIRSLNDSLSSLFLVGDSVIKLDLSDKTYELLLETKDCKFIKTSKKNNTIAYVDYKDTIIVYDLHIFKESKINKYSKEQVFGIEFSKTKNNLLFIGANKNNKIYEFDIIKKAEIREIEISTNSPLSDMKFIKDEHLCVVSFDSSVNIINVLKQHEPIRLEADFPLNCILKTDENRVIITSLSNRFALFDIAKLNLFNFDSTEEFMIDKLKIESVAYVSSLNSSILNTENKIEQIIVPNSETIAYDNDTNDLVKSNNNSDMMNMFSPTNTIATNANNMSVNSLRSMQSNQSLYHKKFTMTKTPLKYSVSKIESRTNNDEILTELSYSENLKKQKTTVSNIDADPKNTLIQKLLNESNNFKGESISARSSIIKEGLIDYIKKHNKYLTVKNEVLLRDEDLYKMTTTELSSVLNMLNTQEIKEIKESSENNQQMFKYLEFFEIKLKEQTNLVKDLLRTNIISIKSQIMSDLYDFKNEIIAEVKKEITQNRDNYF